MTDDYAMQEIDKAFAKRPHELASKNDRPGDIPQDVEARAIEMFQRHTQGMTGHVWDWEKSCEEIRNIWRLRAFKSSH